jgi:hypothetical protein
MVSKDLDVDRAAFTKAVLGLISGHGFFSLYIRRAVIGGVLPSKVRGDAITMTGQRGAPAQQGDLRVLKVSALDLGKISQES